MNTIRITLINCNLIEFCGIKDFKQIQWNNVLTYYENTIWKFEACFLNHSLSFAGLSMFPEFGPEKQMKSENCRKLNLFPFTLALNEWECKYILEVLFMLFFHCSFLCSSGCEENSEKNRWNWKGKKDCWK